MAHWTICTGEYPPDCGGVGDYTAQVAAALAAGGDRVAVCVPPRNRSDEISPPRGVEIVELPDRFGPGARRMLDRRLDGGRSIVLVQYVPNAFGARGANVGWCRWLLNRSRRSGDDVRVMFHEPYFYFEWARPDRCALALVQRAMAATLLRAASTVYLSTAAWIPYLRPFRPSAATDPLVLPIPSSIPPACDPRRSQAQRNRWQPAPGARLVGHLGSYGDHVASLLRRTLPSLLRPDTTTAVVCIGQGSEEFVRDLIAGQPDLHDRIHASGRLLPQQVADALGACDLLIQPFPDGVTTRRTSVMAGLANGRPVLTTSGALTEPEWFASGAVALAPAGDPDAFVSAARRLLADPAACTALTVKADLTYRDRFALEHTIAVLRRSPTSRGDRAPSRGGAAA